MSRCPESRWIQDFLDGELAPALAERFERHAAACAPCAGEVARYRSTFAALERLPLLEPPPALTERVLARVLPSRVRRRWVRAAAWGYAGTLAASVAAVVLVLSQPAARAALELLWTGTSQRMVQAMLFGMNVVAYALLGLVNGWGLLAYAGERLAALGRAFTLLISHPAIETALALAAVSCVAVLWWMRAQGKGRGGEPRHFGLLGL
jgi:anti-sigma factor RsiW